MLFQESLQQKWLFGKILFCKKDGKKVYIVKYLHVITGKVLANNYFLCEIWSESPRRRKKRQQSEDERCARLDKRIESLNAL